MVIYFSLSCFAGISGELVPGSCSCIIAGNGDSLAGAILLQVLAGKTRYIGKTTGIIAANDQRLGEQMRMRCSYLRRLVYDCKNGFMNGLRLCL